MKTLTNISISLIFLITFFCIGSSAYGKTLVVDDDNGSLTENWLIEQLKNLNIQIDVRDVEETGTPDFSEMAEYETIIWHSGGSSSAFFFSSSKNNIRRYLEAGGSVLFSGSGIGRALHEGPYGSIVNDIFNMQYESRASISRLESVFHSPIHIDWNHRYDGYSDLYTPVPSAPDYRSYIESSAMMTADRFSKNYTVAATACRKAYPPYFKAALLGFEIDSMEKGADLLKNTLTWLKQSKRERLNAIRDIKFALQQTSRDTQYEKTENLLDSLELNKLLLAQNAAFYPQDREAIESIAVDLEMDINEIMNQAKEIILSNKMITGIPLSK